MKRTFLFLLTAALLGFGLQSCDREDNNGGGGNGSGTTSVQWVDLGLPSGLLWADRNVGAKNPEDYGNYYAWGETTPKEVYDWNTYAYGSNLDAITKYCSSPYFGLNGFTDSLTTLEASDDAAMANLGDGARMPTEGDWWELINSTTNTWTTRNGVFGRLLTGPNGNSLFLPAAGIRDGLSLNFAGEVGCYWSNTLSQNLPYSAWRSELDTIYLSMDNGGERYCGYSVRAVRTSQD
jgi:hypothetical protein